MKVSVAMVTYNHERFISQAIESALMQQVNFDYEIVIGEDCSTDHTRDIVIDYQQRYPDKIRLLLPEKNLGAKKNGIQVHKACQGEYIALLDGDDYWTFPHKLQKQVDFLDTHPECAICFHSVKVIYDDCSQEPFIRRPPRQKEIYALKDLLVDNFIPACSTMFRNGLFGEFPDWFHVLPIGDWLLHILNAQHGDIGYINEVMGARRVHSGGVWSRTGIRMSQEALEFYKVMNTYLNFRYDRIIRAAEYFHYHRIAKANGDGLGAFVNLLKCIITSPSNLAVSYRRSLISMLEFFPPVYNLLKSWKSKLRSTCS
jgi:glycosyltransferase involved in cell wall biosynthesis